VLAIGGPDNGRELTAMRSLRDKWLKNQPFGQIEIQKYYRIAPQIVNAINAKANSVEMYRWIYKEYIRGCVASVEQDDHETAYHQYKAMVDALSDQYLKKPN
jgi:hypothetical protein